MTVDDDGARRAFLAAVERGDRAGAEAALVEQRRLCDELEVEVLALGAEADELEAAAGRRLAWEAEVWLAVQSWRWE